MRNPPPPGTAPPAGTAARRRRKPRAVVGSARRIAILKSAAAAFRRLGYHGATVAQIASALRMKKGNLYYYFRNKEDILYACHQYSLDRLLALLDDVERSDLAPEVKLHRLIVSAVHTILDELHGTALFLDLEALTPAHLKAVIARRDEFDRGLRRLVDEGMRSGAFAPGHAKLVAFAMVGAVHWIPRWYDPKGPASSDEIADRFADYLVAGLRAGPAVRAPI
jgi:AcrR family transcriptional regulator